MSRARVNEKNPWFQANTGFGCSTDEPITASDEMRETARIAERFMWLAAAAAEQLASAGLVSSEALADELFRASGRLSEKNQGAKMAFLMRRIAISSKAGRKIARP